MSAVGAGGAGKYWTTDVQVTLELGYATLPSSATIGNS